MVPMVPRLRSSTAPAPSGGGGDVPDAPARTAYGLETAPPFPASALPDWTGATRVGRADGWCPFAPTASNATAQFLGLSDGTVAVCLPRWGQSSDDALAVAVVDVDTAGAPGIVASGAFPTGRYSTRGATLVERPGGLWAAVTEEARTRPEGRSGRTTLALRVDGTTVAVDPDAPDAPAYTGSAFAVPGGALVPVNAGRPATLGFAHADTLVPSGPSVHPACGAFDLVVPLAPGVLALAHEAFDKVGGIDVVETDGVRLRTSHRYDHPVGERMASPCGLVALAPDTLLLIGDGVGSGTEVVRLVDGVATRTARRTDGWFGERYRYTATLQSPLSHSPRRTAVTFPGRSKRDLHLIDVGEDGDALEYVRRIDLPLEAGETILGVHRVGPDRVLVATSTGALDVYDLTG